jgi:hypothetical protein
MFCGQLGLYLMPLMFLSLPWIWFGPLLPKIWVFLPTSSVGSFLTVRSGDCPSIIDIFFIFLTPSINVFLIIFLVIKLRSLRAKKEL